MEKQPLISALMSVYNGERFVAEAVESILNQSCTDFEFLVVNDGSTDRSADIIRSFNDPRIVYIENPVNMGLIASLNKGLALARGRYIARMDHDDVALPERFSEQIAHLEGNRDLVVAGSDYYLVTDNRETRSAQHWSRHSDYLKTVLLFSTCFAHPTVMMKNVFRETGLTYEGEFKHTEDYRLWTRLAAQGGFAVIPKALIRYRVHAGQTTVQNRSAQFALSARIREDYLEKLGFTCTETQREIHHLIGNNTFIRQKDQLEAAGNWLLELVRQNREKAVFSEQPFALAIHKFWIDLCGHTSLGFSAYRCYYRSALSRISKTPAGERWRLAAKCLVRGINRK